MHSLAVTVPPTDRDPRRRSRLFGEQEVALRTFDAADPAGTIHVIPPNTPHAFAPGSEDLVVVSFHTVAPEELLEIEVASARSRTYLA